MEGTTSAVKSRPRLAVRVATVAVVACLAVVLVPQALAAVGNGKIAFDHGGSNPDGIWVVDPNGSSAPQQLTTFGFRPRWSPDGTMITFEAPDSSGISQVWVTKADGTGVPKQVTNSQDGASDPSYSNDGSILYVDGGVIYDLLASTPFGDMGNQVVPSDPSYGTPAEPAVSPDGTNIVFTGSNGNSRVDRLQPLAVQQFERASRSLRTTPAISTRARRGRRSERSTSSTCMRAHTPFRRCRSRAGPRPPSPTHTTPPPRRTAASLPTPPRPRSGSPIP